MQVLTALIAVESHSACLHQIITTCTLNTLALANYTTLKLEKVALFYVNE